MIMHYVDPFDTLFAFQRALESRLSDLVAIVELPGVNKEDLNIQAKENTIRIAGRRRSTSRIDSDGVVVSTFAVNGKDSHDR